MVVDHSYMLVEYGILLVLCHQSKLECLYQLISRAVKLGKSESESEWGEGGGGVEINL